MKNAIKTGDIYLLDLGNQFGHLYEGVRPYVVADANEFINSANIVCISPLTGNIYKQGHYDISIYKDYKNGLAKNSVIKLDQITTVDKRILQIYIGNVGYDVMKQAHSNLRRRFSL